MRNVQAVELAMLDCIEQRRAFDELIAAQRKQSAFGHAGNGMVGATDTLQERGDGARRGQLTHELDIADVYTKFERSSCHQRLQFALLQTLLGIETLFLGKTAVMSGHILLAEPFAQVTRD